ncbi:MAG: isochorismatase family cysteine hydrolase [Dehalococcoidia bacterium]|jgi:nicotinamidase-related amidase
MDEYTLPDYQHLALITIDVQNDSTLPGAPLEIKGTMEVVPNIAILLQLFRELSKPVIHIIRLYKEDGSNVDIVRRKRIVIGGSVLRPGSEGAELVKEMKPGAVRLDSKSLLKGGVQELAPNEYAIYKPRWGAFYGTPLEKFLKKHKINTLAFTGCNFPNCPRTSIYEASERDFRLIVVQDALSGIYEKDIEELSKIGCEIVLAQDLVKGLKPA